MRERLNTTPTWALLLILWLFWTVITFVMGVIAVRDLLWTSVFAVGIGLITAAALTFAIKIRLRWENRALGDVSKDVRRQALRAAWKGPVPADPEVRAAAISVAQEQLRQARRARPILIIVAACGLVAAVGSAVVGSAWQLLTAAPHLFLLAAFFLSPKRLHNRLALLSESS